MRKVADNRAMNLGKGTKLLLVSLSVLGAVGGCSKRRPMAQQAPEPSAADNRNLAVEGGSCQRHEDCARGLRCADDKTCQTPKTIECRSREDTCLEEGRCVGRGNRCVATSNADCQKSKRCETDGRCSFKDDRCLALTPEDCKVLCQRVGRCTVQDGTCVAASDKDCKDSDACRQAKRCHMVAGRCVGR